MTHKMAFLEVAGKLVDTGDEMVAVKIVQILLLIINREDICKSPFADNILSLSLKAFGNKNPLVRNNILAVLRELYHLLFELYSNEIHSQAIEVFQQSELHQICYSQMKQLIEIAGGKYKDAAFKGMGMDIITVVLTEAPLVKDSLMSSLMQKAYAFTLSGYLINEIDNFGVIVRAVKSIAQLILRLRHSYMLLQPMLILANSERSWQRYLALEVFCTLFTDYKQIQNLNLRVNEQKHTRVILQATHSC